jgi:hypothetical protein
MTLIDLFVLLVAAVIYFFAHTPLVWTVVVVIAVLIAVRLVRGERVS